MKSPLECLCGNDILVVKSDTFDKEVIYAGNSDKVIGKTIEIEAVCSKCNRELIIELSISDKNWEETIWD